MMPNLICLVQVSGDAIFQQSDKEADAPIDRVSKMLTLCFLSSEPYCVTIHWNRLDETIPMSGHTIGFDEK